MKLLFLFFLDRVWSGASPTFPSILASCEEDFCCKYNGESKGDIILLEDDFNENDKKFECATESSLPLVYQIYSGDVEVMVSQSYVQPLKRDIDGGKTDIFVHEFRPPKRPGSYKIVVRHGFKNNKLHRYK